MVKRYLVNNRALPTARLPATRTVTQGSMPLLLLVLIVAIGCGPAGPKTYPISGTVTFDGEAIPVSLMRTTVTARSG